MEPENGTLEKETHGDPGKGDPGTLEKETPFGTIIFRFYVKF